MSFENDDRSIDRLPRKHKSGASAQTRCWMLPIVVLKFGSSVLATASDLPSAVDEVYRHLRKGTRVLAVVSAFAGDTDRLLGRAREVLGEEAAPLAVAAFVATGEWQSAA